MFLTNGPAEVSLTTTRTVATGLSVANTFTFIFDKVVFSLLSIHHLRLRNLRYLLKGYELPTSNPGFRVTRDLCRVEALGRSVSNLVYCRVILRLTVIGFLYMPFLYPYGQRLAFV